MRCCNQEYINLQKEKVSKFRLYLGYIFIVSAFLFLLLHLFIRLSDGTVVYDIWGLEIPQQPTWTSFIPGYAFMIRSIFEMVSVHGLVGVLVFLPLLFVGGWLLRTEEDLDSNSKNKKKKRNKNLSAKEVMKNISNSLMTDLSLIISAYEAHDIERVNSLVSEIYRSDFVYFVLLTKPKEEPELSENDGSWEFFKEGFIKNGYNEGSATILAGIIFNDLADAITESSKVNYN